MFWKELDAAFPEVPVPKWEPKEGEKIWYVEIGSDCISEHTWHRNWRTDFQNGLIHPTCEAAQEHLNWYKEMLKEKKV